MNRADRGEELVGGGAEQQEGRRPSLQCLPDLPFPIRIGDDRDLRSRAAHLQGLHGREDAHAVVEVRDDDVASQQIRIVRSRGPNGHVAACGEDGGQAGAAYVVVMDDDHLDGSK